MQYDIDSLFIYLFIFIKDNIYYFCRKFYSDVISLLRSSDELTCGLLAY